MFGPLLFLAGHKRKQREACELKRKKRSRLLPTLVNTAGGQLIGNLVFCGSFSRVH